MLGLVSRRLLTTVIMLVVVGFVTFLMFFAGPTDPAAHSCGRHCTPAIIDANRHTLGFDQPVYVQYGDFLKGLFQGRDFPDDPVQAELAPETIAHCAAPCFGYSMVRQQTVTSMLADAFPVTLSLAVGGFVLWMVIGVVGGIIAAVRRGGFLDRTIVGVSLVTYSLPTFFIGMLLLTFVSIHWHLLPIPSYTPLFQDPVAWASGLILPWITVAAVMAAGYVRLTRAYMVETMSEEYVQTARAKGVREWAVVMRHGTRAALTPITSAAGLDFGGMLAGMVIVEQVFSLNGLGRLTVQSVVNVDLPVIVALVLLAAAAYILTNLLVDVLYGWLDPRVRLR